MASLLYGAIVALALTLVGIYYTMTGPKERKVLKKDTFEQFPLVKKEQVSHNSYLFTFALPRETDVLGLPIGQHIQIGANINGKDITRSYTPSSLDQDTKGKFELLVKVYEQGNISKLLGDLAIGDTINVRGPKGFYTYTPNMKSSLAMVAGGTGITPMYQIIKAICEDPSDKTKVSLLYGNVTEEDILLRKELDELAAKCPNITIYNVLNKPPAGWKEGSGYITKELLEEKLPAAAEDSQLLLCGPPPMVSAIKKAAVELGWAKAKPVSKLADQVFVF